MRRFTAWLSAILLPLLLLTGCGGGKTDGKSFTLPLDAAPYQLDPQVADDVGSREVLAGLFESLTRLSDTGAAAPAGAATWTVSPDGTTYTFALVSTQWSNGDPVTSADYAYAISRLQGGSSPFASLAADITAVQAPDDSTLVIQLAAADAGFPARVANQAFMPCEQKFFEKTAGRYGLTKDSVLSNGAFSLSAWGTASLTMAKAAGYHDSAHILPAQVTYAFTAPADPLQALKSGAVDAAFLPAMVTDKSVHVITLRDTVQTVVFNTQRTALSSVKIRQALRDAIDWAALPDYLNSDTSVRATGYIPPDAAPQGGTVDPLPFATDAAGAQQSLAGGLADLSLTAMPDFTLLCADDAASFKLATFIAQCWQRDLSIYNITVTQVAAADLAQSVDSGNYDMALYSSLAPSIPLAFASPGNPAHFSDDAYTALAATADANTLQQRLWTLCPVLPVAFVSRFVGVSVKVTGLVVRPFQGGAFGATFDFRGAGKK
ncbi:MAG: ABC transporter substrate-binding protein [Oscillospiraceae bacterium]|nr:ABC transporter substrate-binding protein [Oscillospiraceae bacterium]